MKSVFRGVALFAVGTMLCAGLVFTADRGLGISGKKANRSAVAQVSQPKHPTSVVRYTREQFIDYLNATGARGGLSFENDKARKLIDRAGNLVEKGLATEAIELIQAQSRVEIPEAYLGHYYATLGSAYAAMPFAASQHRAAVNYERAAEHLDLDNDLTIEVLDQASEIYRSLGRASDVVRVERSKRNVQNGQAPVVDFGRSSRTRTYSPRTVGADDLCTGADPVSPPYSETLNIANDEGDWFAITLAANDDLFIETVSDTPGDTFDDDTTLLLASACNPAWTAAEPPTTDPEVLFFADAFGTESIQTGCLLAGTYYLRVGAWADGLFGSLPTNTDVNITGTDPGCFIPTADAFEPDNEIGSGNLGLSDIGCDVLMAEDEEDEDEEDESGSEDSGDSVSSDSGDGGTTGPPVCELLQAQCRTIFPAGDIDVVDFNVGSESRRVNIKAGGNENCEGGDPANDTVVGISTSDGLIMGINDDTESGVNSELEFCAQANENYAVVVFGAFTTDEFAYELVVDATVGCSIESEPNGACDLADDLGSVVDGAPVRTSGFITSLFIQFSGNLQPDLDWYRFDLPADCFLTATTSATDMARSDTFITLLAGPCPGTVIATNDDQDTGNLIWTSSVGENLTAGEYYVEVRRPAGFTDNEPFPYDLTLACAPPPPPVPSETEPNNSPATCNAIDVDGTVYENEITAGDQDFFCFSLTNDEFIDVTTSGTTGDTVLEILDGTTLGNIYCDDDAGAGLFSNGSCCLPPGDYVVGVQGFSATAAFDYNLTASNLGACSADPDPLNAVCSTPTLFAGTPCPF